MNPVMIHPATIRSTTTAKTSGANRSRNRRTARRAQCLAGVLVAAVSTLPAAAQSLFSPTPFTDANWASASSVQLVAQSVAQPAAPAAAPARQPQAPVVTQASVQVPAPAPEPAAAAPAPAQTAAATPAPASAQGAAQTPVVSRPPAAALDELDTPTGPMLKREATVVGEVVRIGDLVENAGVVADVAIFRAPDLGQTGSVPAARVLDAVRSHHIIWLNTRGLDEVLVTRASRAVTAKDLEARLIRAVAGQGSVTDVKGLAAAFDNEVRTVHVEPNAELGISRFAFDPRSRRFDVTFDVPTSTARRGLVRITGSLIETVEAVVPLRAIAQGEVLKASDVVVERRPKAEAAAVEDVIGFAAKRSLRAGQVIRAEDVMKPELVGRNETVTISFEAPGMVLTTRGKSLEAGALGDMINVLNVQSNRTLQATVSGPGRVTVSAAPPRLAANAAGSATPQR